MPAATTDGALRELAITALRGRDTVRPGARDRCVRLKGTARSISRAKTGGRPRLHTLDRVLCLGQTSHSDVTVELDCLDLLPLPHQSTDLIPYRIEILDAQLLKEEINLALQRSGSPVDTTDSGLGGSPTARLQKEQGHGYVHGSNR